jgi:LPXTG-motif cell wall-anchored protein
VDPAVPQLSVTKVASPLTLPAPGGNFTFTVQVHNPSATDPVKLTALTDNIYGNLATLPGSTCGSLIGKTLAPGATSAACTFSGAFNGMSGASQTDIVGVTGIDPHGTSVTATAKATVGITATAFAGVLAANAVAPSTTIPSTTGDPNLGASLATTGKEAVLPVTLAAGLILMGLAMVLGVRRRRAMALERTDWSGRI